MDNINHDLGDKLKSLINEKKLNLKYSDGYIEWKKKFDYFFNITKDVNRTLDCIYGPNGGIDNYKGSIYQNSNLNIKETLKQKPKKYTKIKNNAIVNKQTNHTFDFLKLRSNKY